MKKKISKEKWKWFGSAGHFICAHLCRFHLTTQVGKYLISTVGEMWQEEAVRRIFAKIRDREWLRKNKHLKGDYFDVAYMKRFGFEKIRCDRLYETMVFKADKVCKIKECNCGIPSINGHELDFLPANTSGEAAQNHMSLCEKYASF